MMSDEDRQSVDDRTDHDDDDQQQQQPKESFPVLSKEEAQQLIQAAGQKQSPEALEQLIQSKGYTASQMDALAGIGRKTPLQQACWKGNLQSIKYLLEEVGCNVNCYSEQTYSYGKTAIFFALTQSRREVVQYLLSLPNINVSIVNNKGQSVLTLAASHAMPVKVLQTIQSKEETDLTKWWNFRATHSDNLEYGDLDVRFLERPLRDTDVVTEYAVNGTTKQSRKGAFQRRNPEAAKEWQRHRQQAKQGKKTGKKSKEKMTVLSKEQQQAIDSSWQILSSDRATRKDMELLNAIITIVEQSDGLRKPWIPEMAHRLLELGYNYDSVSRLSLAVNDNNDNNNDNGGMEDPMNRENNNNGRTTSLFLKLLSKLQGDHADGVTNTDSSKHEAVNQNLKKKKTPGDSEAIIPPTQDSTIGSSEWLKVALPLQHLSISRLEQSSLDGNSSKKELALHSSIASIVFVNDYKSLRNLWDRLESFETNSSNSDDPFVLAMDSEWATTTIIKQDDESDDGSSMGQLKLSTLQLAFCDPSVGNDEATPSICVYIVDLLVKESSSSSSENRNDNNEEEERGETFQDLAQKLVHWMIYERNCNSNGQHSSGDATLDHEPTMTANGKDKMWLLGFALGHDLKMLQKYCQEYVPPSDDATTTTTTNKQQWRSQILDLQMLLRERRRLQFPTKQLPGLKTCTQLFTSCELSKEEQCSDWSKRPLSQSQIQYAALDAAILLFLLAEEYRPDLMHNPIK